MVAENNGGLETFVVVGTLFIEQFINRRVVKFLLGMLLKQGFEIFLMLLGIGLFNQRAEDIQNEFFCGLKAAIGIYGRDAALQELRRQESR